MSQTSLTGPFGLLVCLVASEDCSALLVLAAGPAQLPTQVVCCVTVRRQLMTSCQGMSTTHLTNMGNGASTEILAPFSHLFYFVLAPLWGGQVVAGRQL